jgi:hypothetical protein
LESPIFDFISIDHTLYLFEYSGMPPRMARLGYRRICTRLVMKLTLLALMMLVALPADGAEPVGCDHFAWPLITEQAMLTGTDKLPAAVSPMNRDAGKAIALKLAPISSVKLPMAPERAPKGADSYAGFIRFSAAAKPGLYKITLSDAAWIDVVQNGRYLKSVAHAGALECPGVRKSVKFAIGAEPFTIQLTGAAVPSISIAITPAD